MRRNCFNTLLAALLLGSLLAACNVAPATSIPIAMTFATATSRPTASPVPTAVPTTTPPPPTATPLSSPTPIPSWTTFRSQVGFSVALPGTPTEQTKLGESLLGPITTYTATLEIDPQHSYRVVALVYPGRPITRDDLGGIYTLEKLRDQTIKANTAGAVRERSVFLGPFVGRELEIASAGDSMFRTRLYVAGATIYQLTARSILPAGDSEAALDVQRFFDSFAISAPRASLAPAWQVFRLDGVKCTLALPVQPGTSEHSTSSLVGPVTTTTYTANQDGRGVRFSVSASEYPDRVFAQDDPNGKMTITKQRDALVKAVGGRLFDEQPLTYGAVRGREVLVNLPDGGYARARFYVIGNRLYQLTLITHTAISSPAEGRALVPDYDEVGRFFLSFGPDM